jgi:Family of unknown function (DUF6152)
MTSMKLTALAALVAAGVVCVAVRPLVAHHSAAMFDNQKTMEIAGTIKEFQWTNPHVWIQVERQNAGGAKEEWSVEGGSPNSLSRNGWRKSTFTPGAAVSIRINPMRDGTHAGNFVGAKFADGKTLGRWE